MSNVDLELSPSAAGSISFSVRVSPRARRNAIAGVLDGALHVRLAAPPIEGRANQALCRFLAECLNIPQSAVRIVSGERGRQKRVEIRGVPAERIRALAGGVPQKPAGAHA